MTTTLDKTMKSKTYYSTNKVAAPLKEITKSVDSQQIKVVFIPKDVTPLDVYEASLLKSGMNPKHVKEIIEGLAESPLYAGPTTK